MSLHDGADHLARDEAHDDDHGEAHGDDRDEAHHDVHDVRDAHDARGVHVAHEVHDDVHGGAHGGAHEYGSYGQKDRRIDRDTDNMDASKGRTFRLDMSGRRTIG